MPNSSSHHHRHKLDSSSATTTTITTATRMTYCSATDLDFPPDNEFVELVCENGQIMMHGQSSSRNRKNLSVSGGGGGGGGGGFSSPSSKKDAAGGGGGDAVRFGNMDAAAAGGLSSVHHHHMGGLNQEDDDDTGPWLSYPLEDTVVQQHDYDSDFFSELTGVNLDSLSSSHQTHTTRSRNFGAVPFDNGNNTSTSYSQMIGDSNLTTGTTTAATRPRGSSVDQLECQNSNPSLPPRVSDFNRGNVQQASYRNSKQAPEAASNVLSPKMQKRDQVPITGAPLGLMNFSYYSRPAALVKANLQSVSVAPSASLSSVDRSGCKVKMPGSNRVESSVIDLTTSSRGVAVYQKPPVQIGGKVDIGPSTSIPAKESSTAEQSGAISREDASRTTEFTDTILRQTLSFAASTNAERPDTEKSVEPPVASSSMCSANSAGGTSNDYKHSSKRKSREADESEYQSEDVEEESAGARKQSNARGGSGAKRTRAAEVHNLSERRRRDRINEKMRALQELIPNCNKVDKASMLDEAIEYLKTLQLQVQIMSMGTGMYMPPMMLPTGMNRMSGQHMPHFPHMGVGMGMGFGMGMLDMGSGSSMMQVPPMHNMQFPCPPLSGHNNFPTMPGSNLQMFGHPGRGMPMLIPQPPYAPPSEGPFTKSVPVPDISRTATSAEIPGPASTSSSKDINLQVIQKANVETQQNPKSQDQEARDGLKLSTLAQRHDQTPHVATTEKSTLPTGMGP